jgi:hypothetical protein
MYSQSTARWLLLAALLLPLLSRPALAAEPPTERILIDATFRVIPPADGPPCMAIEPGTLTVQVANLEERSNVRPTTFHFQGYRGSDSGVQLAVVINQQETSTTVHLEGALYCWYLSVYAPVADDAPMATRSNYTQTVTLRMTHRPD